MVGGIIVGAAHIIRCMAVLRSARAVFVGGVVLMQVASLRASKSSARIREPCWHAPLTLDQNKKGQESPCGALNMAKDVGTGDAMSRPICWTPAVDAISHGIVYDSQAREGNVRTPNKTGRTSARMVDPALCAHTPAHELWYCPPPSRLIVLTYSNVKVLFERERLEWFQGDSESRGRFAYIAR